MNQIKSRWSDNVIYEGEESIKRLVEKNKADLQGADLQGADLWGADLQGADLWGADLRGANLSGANLSGANLSRANLSRADLSGAKGIDKHICTPLMMLYDQPGKVRAYKLVKENMEGPFNGGIKYEIGKTYEVKTANTDDNEQCAEGINLATLGWCIINWKPGYHILIAEFTAKDLAAIPIATDGKFRVFHCKIVGEKNLKEIGLEKEVKK